MVLVKRALLTLVYINFSQFKICLFNCRYVPRKLNQNILSSENIGFSAIQIAEKHFHRLVRCTDQDYFQASIFAHVVSSASPLKSVLQPKGMVVGWICKVNNPRASAAEARVSLCLPWRSNSVRTSSSFQQRHVRRPSQIDGKY